jgi:protein-tyrosine phosphatase
LILFLLEIPLEAITNDYMMSEEELQPEMESRLVEIRSIGLTEDFAHCPKNWIEEIDRHLKEKYGDVKGYFQVIGFGEEDQARLLANLKVEKESW